MIDELPERLATAARLLHLEAHLNYSGHISARLPGPEPGLLIHTYDSDRAVVRPEELLRCGLDGRPQPDSPAGRPPLEVFIHTEIYRARPDVQAVLHTHSELSALFTLAETRLQPMKAAAVRWATGIPVHPDPTLIRTPRQGRELAATLGQHQAVLLRAHGGAIVAESIEAVFVDAIHFDENARAQLEASALGRLKPLTPGELEALDESAERERHVRKLWSYYVARGRAAGILGE
jgi:ribulose-5-phosphate 4-epimerase/fuculose-1-phosphate aldolase